MGLLAWHEQILVMDQGKCIEQGAPRALLEQPHSVFAGLAGDMGGSDSVRYWNLKESETLRPAAADVNEASGMAHGAHLAANCGRVGGRKDAEDSAFDDVAVASL